MKQLPLFLLSLLFTTCMYGQTYPFEVAAEGGPAFSYVWGKGSRQIKNQKPMVGFQTGLAFRYHSPKVLGIKTGIYVERKGFVLPLETLNGEGKDVTYRYQSQYHYITVPLLLSATVGRRVQFFVNAGGYVSGMFRIHVFLKELKIDNVNPGGYQYVDAGFAGGMGLRVPLLQQRLVLALEARNQTGFLKVVKNTEAKDALHNTSTSFIFSVAYAFNSKKKK